MIESSRKETTKNEIINISSSINTINNLNSNNAEIITIKPKFSN